MTEKPVTQGALMAWHREEMGPICWATLQLMIARGLPTVKHGKKARFLVSAVRAWILAAREVRPVVQEARDAVFRHEMRKGA